MDWGETTKLYSQQVVSAHKSLKSWIALTIWYFSSLYYVIIIIYELKGEVKPNHLMSVYILYDSSILM